jgi:NitT/TauT family transport system substrate-binding protein
MKKKSKKILALLSVFIFVLFTACSNNKDKNGPESGASQEEKMGSDKKSSPIRVGLLSIDDVLPLVVADKEEDFKKAGLDVEIFPFKSSIDQSKAMEAGQLDIVMNDMIVQALMKKGGLDTKVLAFAFGADVTEGRFVVVSAPDSGINKVEDLYGKKVAISENTMMDYLIYQYEKNLDLDSEKIEKVNVPDILLRMEMLLEGKEIDAAILPDPLASFAISKGAYPVIDDTKLSENFSQSVIIARDEFIDSHKEELNKFMEVYFASMEKINENPDKYKELAMENARVPEDIQDEYKTPTFTPNKVPTQEDVKRVTDRLVGKQLIDKAYSYQDLVSTDFVK